MSFIRELLNDSGQISAMRVMSIICCLSAVGIAIVGIQKPQVDYEGLTLLVSAFLTAAFGGKIAQKSIELKK